MYPAELLSSAVTCGFFFLWQHFVNQEDLLKSKLSLKPLFAPPQLTHYNVAKRGSPKARKDLHGCAVGLRDLFCYGGGGVDWSSIRYQNVVCQPLKEVM